MPVFIHKIVIGDWSDDGHKQKEYFEYACSHDAPEVKAAYELAVKKSGVALDHQHANCYHLCTQYEDYTIPGDVLDDLKAIGVNLDEVFGI